MTELIHHGLHRQRLEYPCEQTTREQAFADTWERYAGKEHNALRHLMLVGRQDPLSIFGDQREAAISLTQEHATLAATVVQWLGTNVGFGFLEEALRGAGYRVVKEARDA